jgi:glycosyltransferase involved in cell wall biosynthesis
MPPRIKDIYWAYRNKATNRLFGLAHMPAQGKKKGDVLLSYIVEPFTRTPQEGFSNYHTMYWECYEIARLFSKRGYAVDIKEAKDHSFVPKKRYAVCIDAEDDLERLAGHLPHDCKKVHHILISHWEAYNDAEEKRLAYLKERRGMTLLPRRKMAPSNNARAADFLEGFGNKAIFKTFEKFGKPIFFIPISAVLAFPSPENKDFASARKHFIWFGGGGAVLKGLDLALEAFAQTSDLHLHVCGPIYGEKDFTDEYKKELEETENIHVYGRIDVAGPQFKELTKKCGAIIYPSGGEGSSGAVVQAMHAGLVPIITHETGIQEDSGYIPLIDPTPKSVAKAAQDFSQTEPVKIRKKALAIWAYARERYTREAFSKSYAKFIDEKLKI